VEDNKKCDVKDAEDNGKQAHITRRKLLTTAGAGALAVAASELVVAKSAGGDNSDSSKNTDELDVIVVGGGFCGVTAARELGKQGYKVTILEARNRLGGRTFTANFGGNPTDMGGTWVNWLQPHVWSELHRYGVGVSETKGAAANPMIYLDYNGRRHETTAAEVWPSFEAAASAFFEDAYGIMPRPAEPFADDQWIKSDRFSVQEKLDAADLSPVNRILLDTWFTLCGAADLSEVSWVDMLRWYALSGFTMTGQADAISRYKMKGGTKVLLEKIAEDSGADIRLGVPIKSVRQTADYAEVTMKNGDKLKAKSVIITVPLNTLSDIDFSPRLSAKKRKVSLEKHVGNGTKFHALLDKEYPMATMWAPGSDVPISYLLWDKVFDGKTHVIGFGPSMDTLDVNDTAAVQRAIRQFIPDAKVESAFGYQWGMDPYAKGVWGVSRPGQLSNAIGELQASQGRIHFGSGDFANGWRGFIDGAIEQGIVTARKAQEQMKS